MSPVATEALADTAATRVLAALEDEGSDLLNDPRTASELRAQVVAIATTALQALQDDGIEEPPPVATSVAVGERRAAFNIHPSASLRAAELAFAETFPLLIGTLPEFSLDGVVRCANALQRAIGSTIVSAAYGYVDNLLDRLSAVHIEERRALSRDLHDRTMQGLAAALQRLDISPTPVAEVTRILTETADDTRSMALELRQLVGERRLDEAIDAYLIDAWNGTAGLPAVELIQTGVPRRLRVLAQEETFVITREAVQNAVRHAAASRITVALAWLPDSVLVSVADDGVGFDAGSVGPGRLGLIGARERAATIGASFEVRAATGGGTLVRIRVRG